MRWLTWVGVVLVGLVALPLLIAGISWLRFGPVALFGHTPITITLPYGPENEPRGMLPLGEVEGVHPSGHPGIDFQWDYAAPLIATFDGTITRIEDAEDMGEPVIYVTLQQGEHTSTYKELDALGPTIAKGVTVKQGDVIGYPHGHMFSDGGGHMGYQVHWEFGYDSFPGSVRLCPLTYFYTDSLARINALWAKIKPGHANPTGQQICNGEYDGKDQ